MEKFLVIIALLACSLNLGAQTLGKDARYCNPLPMVMGEGGNASGDVSVFQWEGKYYMFCTGGGAWVSEDMLNWDFHYVANVPVAPDVVPYKGKFYMTGNGVRGVWVADNPLGPYELSGTWINLPGIEGGWTSPFDTHIYIDDDGQPYLFWPGMAISGIHSVKLNPDNLNEWVGPVTHHFSFNPKHIWERQGEHNEYSDVAWIEGPWVYKYKGTYYLQYSGSGTQWRTYAEGYYKAKKVEGPYTYAGNNPLLRRTTGVVTGPAHGSMVTGPDGNIWQFYTIVLRSGGRRVGMDRVIVDKKGNLTCEVTDTPQWAPGVVKDPAKGGTGSIIISEGKVAASVFGGPDNRAASSYMPGRDAVYAVDDNTSTWWSPDPNDLQPTLTLNLSAQDGQDRIQIFQVDGLRILFGGGSNRGFSGSSVATPVYRYKLDVSLDGQTWTNVVDQSANKVSRNTVFDEIAPTECRYVRLTMLDWPKSSPLSILDMTVFGRPTSYFPNTSPIAPVLDMSNRD